MAIAPAASVTSQVVTRSPRARPAAKAAAIVQSAGPVVGATSASARRSAAASPAWSSTRGSGPTVMSVTRSVLPKVPARSRRRRSATSSRVVSPWWACMEAETSSRITACPRSASGAGQAGRARVSASASNASN